MKEWEKDKRLHNLALSTGFENEVFLALELAVSAKSEMPQTLMERSKAITKKNFLWGWAQQQAVSEFGSQWIQLLSRPDQKLISQVQVERRTVASAKPEKSEKSENKKVIPTELPAKKVQTRTGTMFQ